MRITHCDRCGNEVFLTGELYGNKVSYSGTCTECGRFIIEHEK